MQDVEATADKDDSRSLNITVHRPFAARSQSAVNPLPVLSAKFIFDDYIRCMSARQRLQRRGAALRHRKMTTLACLLELPVMAAPPSHYYALAPFNSGSQGYVWSPSPRSYTVRSTGSSGSVSPKSDTTSPPRPPQPKSKFISPKHSKILQEKQERVKTSKTTQAEQENTNVVTLDPLGVNKKPSSGSSESYMRPMTMDTPPPKNLKPKPSQAQALASVLGEGIEIDEIEATEDLTDMRFQMLTIDDAEEASEELSSDEGNSPDNTDFPRRKVRKRRSTGGSVGSPKRDSLLSEETSAPEVRQIRSSRSSDPVSLSAPPTPTGQRRSKSHTVKRKNSTSDSNARVKSLPAISLHYTRGLLRKKSTQRTRTKPKPHRPRVVSVRTAPRKQPPS